MTNIPANLADLSDADLLALAAAAAKVKKERGLRVVEAGKRLPDVGAANRIAARVAGFMPDADGNYVAAETTYTASHVGGDYRPPVGDLRAAGLAPSENPKHDGEVTNVTAAAIIAAAEVAGFALAYVGKGDADAAARSLAGGIGSDFHANYSATRPRSAKG